MRWTIRAVTAVVVLLLAFDVQAQSGQATKCPEGLFVHQPSGLCLSGPMQDRVNCIQLVFDRDPRLAEVITREIRDGAERVELEGGVGLILRRGNLRAEAARVAREAKERNVKYEKRELDICLGTDPKPIKIVQRRENATREATEAPECQDVRIADPEGSPTKAQASRYTVERRFRVRWLPENCPAIVEMISEQAATSGDELGDRLGSGKTQIRLLSRRSGRLLAQQWVNVKPPQSPEPVIHLTASDAAVSAQIEDSNGQVRPLRLGVNGPIAHGHYRLRWSNSSGAHEWDLRNGGEYWAHQQLQQAPALVEILPTQTQNARISDGNGPILSAQPRELSAPGTELKLSDGNGDIADLRIAPADGGGVQLKIEPAVREPAVREPSYVPALIGGGCAVAAGAIWVAWLRPAASDAEDRYNGLAPGGDFGAARDEMSRTAMRSNVALGVAITSLAVGAAVQAWEIWR